jgi:hypothetical protein
VVGEESGKGRQWLVRKVVRDDSGGCGKWWGTTVVGAENGGDDSGGCGKVVGSDNIGVLCGRGRVSLHRRPENPVVNIS